MVDGMNGGAGRDTGLVFFVERSREVAVQVDTDGYV